MYGLHPNPILQPTPVRPVPCRRSWRDGGGTGGTKALGGDRDREHREYREYRGHYECREYREYRGHYECREYHEYRE